MSFQTLLNFKISHSFITRGKALGLLQTPLVKTSFYGLLFIFRTKIKRLKAVESSTEMFCYPGPFWNFLSQIEIQLLTNYYVNFIYLMNELCLGCVCLRVCEHGIVQCIYFVQFCLFCTTFSMFSLIGIYRKNYLIKANRGDCINTGVFFRFVWSSILPRSGRINYIFLCLDYNK